MGEDEFDLTLQGGLFGGAQPEGSARPALPLHELLARGAPRLEPGIAR